MNTNAQAPLRKIGVIGAGPAGLATAVALRKQGLDVQVYEKAKEFRPIGAGLNLSPNGIRSLSAIDSGLVEQLKQQGSQINRLNIRMSNSGESVFTMDMSSEDYDQPFVAIRWFCLQETLRAMLPLDSIHLNHRLIGFDQNPEKVTLHFENGATSSVDLLIGADGVRSAVRHQLLGIGGPDYGGMMTWRGLLKYEHCLLPVHEATGFSENSKIFLLFNNGNGYISWSLEMSSETIRHSKSDNEAKAHVVQELKEWHPMVQEVVALTAPEIIVERPVGNPVILPRWSNDRVTLVGDAAHYMGPSLGQGTNSTFEDVWVLSACLSNSTQVSKALAQYEQNRRERATIVQYRTLLSASKMNKGMTAPIDAVPAKAKLPQKDFSNWLYRYCSPV